MAENIVNQQPRLSRRLITLIGSAIIAALVIALLYNERVDVLYILATLGVVALLLVVALSDLSGKNVQPPSSLEQ